jgi:hypothetical protein
MQAELFACEGRDQPVGDIKGSVNDVFRQFSILHGLPVHLALRPRTKNFRLGARATLRRPYVKQP